MRPGKALSSPLGCLLALVASAAIAGCGTGAASPAKGGGLSAAAIERNEEAAQSQQEAAELAKDHELLVAIESKKREEAASENAKHTEAVAAARAKKKEQAAAKKAKKREEEAEANAKKREKALEAEARKKREAAAKRKRAAKAPSSRAASRAEHVYLDDGRQSCEHHASTDAGHRGDARMSRRKQPTPPLRRSRDWLRLLALLAAAVLIAGCGGVLGRWLGKRIRL